MPMTATHPTAGVLDATLPDLGVSLEWDAIHRPKTPVGLSCRGCGNPVHAKLSPQNLRFFAHNREEADCPLNGESIAHRLLKAELAAALRAAGWHAELEVPGTGWRADVLGTSPDGQRRVAWEAQLASTTAEELRERTERMAAEMVDVCWVTDADAFWLRHVPSVRVRADDAGLLTVIDGAARFIGAVCPDPRRCQEVRSAGPCAGHGSWSAPPGLTLATFVASVCRGQLRPVTMRRYFEAPVDARSNGTIAWTTKTYVDTEKEALLAQARRQAWDEEQAKAARAHENQIEALMTRQQALVRITVAYYKRTTGQRARALDGAREPSWAMGVPVLVEDSPVAVICPVASRVANDPAIQRRLHGLTVIVATEAEQQRLAKACSREQQFRVVHVPSAPASASRATVSPTPSGGNGISVREAVSRMFGGY
jgi:competence protein CoiA